VTEQERAGQARLDAVIADLERALTRSGEIFGERDPAVAYGYLSGAVDAAVLNLRSLSGGAS